MSTGVARRVDGDLLGRPRDDDPPAPRATLGAEVDHVVGGLDDVEVVLDDDHGVALVDETVQHVEEPPDVLEVQPRRRLVEDVHRASRRPLAQLARELHPLRLTTGERGRRLSEPHVAEPDVDERLQVRRDGRQVLEECERLLDRQVEDVGDGEPSVADLERLAVVATPLADLAGHVDVGEEVHLDAERAVAVARLAAAALHVEAEAPRLVAAELRLRCRRVQLAQMVEQPRVGRGVRARRATDG